MTLSMELCAVQLVCWFCTPFKSLDDLSPYNHSCWWDINYKSCQPKNQYCQEQTALEGHDSGSQRGEETVL